MAFEQQIIATIIGSVAGFIFAIVLFYLTQIIKEAIERKRICKYAKREFEFNLGLIRNFHSNINKTIEQITNDDRNIFYYFKYSDIERLHLFEAFKKGLLYDKLDNEDLSKLGNMLYMYNMGEQLINDKIRKWKEEQIDKQSLLNSLRFERDQMEKHVAFIPKVLDKFK